MEMAEEKNEAWETQKAEAMIIKGHNQNLYICPTNSKDTLNNHLQVLVWTQIEIHFHV